MILNIYKPLNWTSFDVVAKLRGILQTKKIGHAGTLDPLADGVLVILTGKDTKKQNLLMSTKKEYIANVAIGLDSDSYDLETKLKDSLNFKGQSINKDFLSKYIGQIEQTVPPYSAVKVKGKKLYEMARNNKINQVSLPVKQVTVYDLQILDEYTKDLTKVDQIKFDENILSKIKNAKILKIKIVCSSGFYVRSFAHDIGGVLVSLTRTKVGEFKIEDSVKINEVSDFVKDSL